MLFACCGTLLVLLSSCAKDKEPNDEIIERPVHRVLEGSIEDNVLKVQNDPWAGECEKSIRDIQIEMARELDRRQAEIAAISPPPSGGVEVKKIQLGSMTLLNGAKSPITVTGWTSYYSSWNEIIADYQKIKETPTDLNWRWLNSAVRGVLLDDVGRVVDGWNYGIGKDSAPALRSLRDVLVKCEADANCGDPDFTSVATFLSEQPYYKVYLNAIKVRTDKTEKREWVSRFIKRVNVELKSYEFVRNDLMLRQDSDHYVLPLGAGAFYGFTEEIQAFIETAWASATGIKVKVEWRNPESSPLLFRFLYRDAVGERAYVMRNERTINLFPSSYNTTVAHEIGHVIGFKDNYFTVWDEKNCRYENQSREDDIMSSSRSGNVLPEHWEKLQQEYPVTTR